MRRSSETVTCFTRTEVKRGLGEAPSRSPCLDLAGYMNSDRATFVTRIALSAATAILILAGATLNVNGRVGQAALLAAIAGLLALAAGALNRTWKIAVPLAIAALVVSVIT